MAQNGYSDRLLAIIDARNQLAATGDDVHALISLAAERARALTTADAAMLELADGDDVVHAAFAGDREVRAPGAAGSALAVPVCDGEATLGTVTAYAIEPAAFDDADVHTLELLGGLLAARVTLAGARPGQVRRDALTGLGDRHTYDERLLAECSRANRHGQPLTLCLLDLDEFGLLNERRGDDAGDEVLRQVARILSRLRAEDTPFRIGGDEFAVLLPGITASQAAVPVERLAGEIAARIEGGVTASFGLADAPLAPQELHEAAAARLVAANARRIWREAARA